MSQIVDRRDDESVKRRAPFHSSPNQRQRSNLHRSFAALLPCSSFLLVCSILVLIVPSFFCRCGRFLLRLRLGLTRNPIESTPLPDLPSEPFYIYTLSLRVPRSLCLPSAIPILTIGGQIGTIHLDISDPICAVSRGENG